MWDLIIVGGGISGLALAWRAKQAGLRFRLLESAPHVGGAVTSNPGPWGLTEEGPESLLVSHPVVRDLLDELDLTGSLVPLAQQPVGLCRPRILDLLTTEPPKAAAALSPGALQPWTMGDQTLVGNVAHLHPLQNGNAARYRSLHVTKCQEVKNTIQEASFPGGLSVLIESLRDRFSDAIVTDMQVTRLCPPPQGWTVQVNGGQLRARTVAIATSAGHAAKLMSTFDPGCSQAILDLPSHQVAVLNLIFRAEQLAGLSSQSQGVQLPPGPGGSIAALGLSQVRWSGRIAPGYANLRLILGGLGRERALLCEDSHLVSEALTDLRTWFGISSPPLAHRLSRHWQKLPAYGSAYDHKAAVIETAVSFWPGLALAGNWLHGAGIESCLSLANDISLGFGRVARYGY